MVASAAMIGSEREGEVVEFDREVGLGVVLSADGALVPFHCTQIADGTREITVGAGVRFTVRPGLPGRWEAFDVRPA